MTITKRIEQALQHVTNETKARSLCAIHRAGGTATQNKVERALSTAGLIPLVGRLPNGALVLR